MPLQTKQTQKKRYGALQLSCSSAKEVEGDGSVAAVAFFAEEEDKEEEGEVIALQRSATMPLQTKQTQK